MKTVLETLRFLKPLKIRPEILFQEVLGFSAQDIFLKQNEKISDAQSELLSLAFKRLKAGEPLQYIVGKTHFWRNDFRVGPGVLIPRPETEFLVEKLLKAEGRIIELGAGSGNIGISVVLENSKLEWCAIEKSPMAFIYAAKNARLLLGKKEKYTLLNQDFFEFPAKKPMFDWVVSNPPYVAPSEKFDKLIEKEPKLALFPGPKGLEAIELLMKKSLELLKPRGRLLFEIGFSQKTAILRLLKKYPFSLIEVIKDYSDLDRVVMVQRT